MNLRGWETDNAVSAHQPLPAGVMEELSAASVGFEVYAGEHACMILPVGEHEGVAVNQEKKNLKRDKKCCDG